MEGRKEAQAGEDRKSGRLTTVCGGWGGWGEGAACDHGRGRERGLKRLHLPCPFLWPVFSICLPFPRRSALLCSPLRPSFQTPFGAAESTLLLRPPYKLGQWAPQTPSPSSGSHGTAGSCQEVLDKGRRAEDSGPGHSVHLAHPELAPGGRAGSAAMNVGSITVRFRGLWRGWRTRASDLKRQLWVCRPQKHIRGQLGLGDWLCLQGPETQRKTPEATSVKRNCVSDISE